MNVKVSVEKFEGTPDVPQSKSYLHRYLFLVLLTKSRAEIEISESTYNMKDIVATLNVLSGCNVGIEYENGILKLDASMAIYDGSEIDCLESATTLRMGLFILVFMFGIANLTGSIGLIGRPLTYFEGICEEFGLEYTKEFLSGNLGKDNAERGRISVVGDLRPLFDHDVVIEEIESSQYISAILLIVSVSDLSFVPDLIFNGRMESVGYLEITKDVLTQIEDIFKQIEFIFDQDREYLRKIKTYNKEISGTKIDNIEVPKDASSEAFWLVANAMGSNLVIAENNSLQPDAEINKFLASSNKTRDIKIIDFKGCPDLFPIMTVYAMTRNDLEFIHFDRNSIKESNRIIAMLDQLRDMGAEFICENGRIFFNRTQSLKPVKINGFNDHRIVMSFAILSLIVENYIEISGAESVEKSYPNFWDDFKKLGGKIEY